MAYLHVQWLKFRVLVAYGVSIGIWLDSDTEHGRRRSGKPE